MSTTPAYPPVSVSGVTYVRGTEVPCQEDMDCWDCVTMGNGVCGESAAPPHATVAQRPKQAMPAQLPATGYDTVALALGGFITFLVGRTLVRLAKWHRS